MNTLRSLPVIMPKVAGQRWSCHSCGACCRSLVGHLEEEERERIDEQGWAQRLGVPPYVRVGRGWALNKRADGACVFLDKDNRCRIHAEFGEQAKPLACRIFPFSVRAVRGGWQSSLRFDCPSVIGSKGQPIEQHRAWLTRLVPQLSHSGAVDDAQLKRGLRATPDEIDVVTRRFSRWIRDDARCVRDRLIGAARVIATLSEANLAKVRGKRFAELLDLLIREQATGKRVTPSAPTPRQRGMLRQLSFAHAEHVTLAEMRSGVFERMRKRWQQLRSARAFLVGRGPVPAVHGFRSGITFEEVDAIDPSADRSADLDDLVIRYFLARVESRTIFGRGYYGWSIVSGLGALILSVAAAAWLARYRAAGEGRGVLTFDDVGHALGVVDRAATRLPALGTMAERARVQYLLADDGAARLIHAYALCSKETET